MKSAAWHAWALLGMGARRPLVWIGVLAWPWIAGMMAFLVRELPEAVALPLAASAGALVDLLRGLGLARSSQWLRAGQALPTLPMTHRARAVGETIAGLVALSPGLVVAVVVHPWAEDHFPRAGQPAFEALPFILLSPTELLTLLALAVPSLVGGALQQPDTRWDGGPEPIVPAALLAVAAWTGVVGGPGALAAAALGLAGTRLALGRLPRWKLPLPDLRRQRLSARRGMPAMIRLRVDLARGLLRAHVVSIPGGMLMALAILAVPALGGRPVDPAVIAVISVAVVGLLAALQPLGLPLSALGGRPWTALPLAEATLGRAVFTHAAISILLLPSLAATVGRPDTAVWLLAIAAPFALAGAGSIAALRLRGPGRGLLALALALGVAWLAARSLVADRPWTWLAAASLLAVTADLVLLADVLFPSVAARLAYAGNSTPRSETT